MTAARATASSGTGTVPAAGQVEVRLLQGPVRIRRSDGRLVDATALRTRKTADLLTILALSAGQSVPVPQLLAALWPDVEQERGRASLRTAACEVRRALGCGAQVRRDKAGVVLTQVWTDASAFVALAAEAAGSRGTDPARALHAAREAEHLHLAELTPCATDADWVVEARARLLVARKALLADGAEAALELGRLRDALSLASRLVEVDPYDERGYRALMLAHAGLGEPERVVQTWSACHSALAGDLGLDPSPQTRAAHAQALRVAVADDGDAARGHAWPSGRVLDDDELRELVAQALSAEPAPDLVSEVAAVTDRHAESVTALVSQWVRERRLVASSRGLVVVPPGSEASLDGERQLLVSLHTRLSTAELEALEVVAVSRGLVTAEAAGRALDVDRQISAGLLGRLEVLDLVTAGPDGYRVRDPLLARVLVGSLRPAALAALQRRVAPPVPVIPRQRQPEPESGDRALRALLDLVAPLVAARDLRAADAAVARASSAGPDGPGLDPRATGAAGGEALVLLGAARRVADRVCLDAVPAEPTGPLLASGISLTALRLLVRHDLGERVPVPVAPRRPGGRGRWLPLRLAVERGDLALAEEVARRPVPAAAPLERVLDGLAEGRLLAALGDAPSAARRLRAALDLALRRDVRLLLPEVAARLALVTAAHDPAAAARYLDRAEEALGDAVFGRERVAVLLARAALRAGAGRCDDASATAGVAADVARRLGLAWLEGEARAAQEAYRAGRDVARRVTPDSPTAA